MKNDIAIGQEISDSDLETVTGGDCEYADVWYKEGDRIPLGDHREMLCENNEWKTLPK